MPIQVSCENCGKSLKAPDNMAGKRAKCPQCGGVIQIPAEQVFDAEIVEPTPTPTPQLDSLLDDELAYRVAQPDPVSQPSGESRYPCPACGEMIATGAAKCRFCGEIFDAALKRKEKKRKASSGGDDDTLTTGEIVLGILCSGIGCILGLIWVVQGKSKGWKMVGVSLLAALIWFVIRTALEMAAQR